MDKIIELKGRYSTHKLKQLSPVKKGRESKTYKLVLGSEEDVIRSGYTEENNVYIDPSGGPFITIGSVIKGHKVKSIDYSYELSSYVITFE